MKVVPPRSFIFCGADFGSTIARDLQLKLKPYLHSSQQQMTMRSLFGIYPANLGLSGFDLTDDFIRFRRRSGLTENGCF